MAEIAVNVVIDKLAPLLLQEAKLLRGVRKEMSSIKDELKSIQSFLRDADGKGEINDGVKTWVKQVREVAYHIEDVIDECILHLAERSHQRGFIAFLQKVVRCPKNLKRRHDIAKEIQDIKTTIREIKERSRRYSFNSSERGSSSSVKTVAWQDDPRLASLFIEEADVVGIEGPKQQLITWLVKGESKQTVISLVGMGGLGKTTLARKVFDNQEVKGNFDCSAWIIVSQLYKTEEILRTMLKQFYANEEEAALKGIDTMEPLLLIGKLREYLLQKRYLVVFDDVWAITFWESIKHALPQNVKGSSIIITTRNGDVAKSSTDDIIQLPPLPQEKAWELFCKKVFKSSCCPKELEALSLDIVKKCQGLPLAIVLIGGLLSMKGKVASQWQMFHDSLGTELESNLKSITTILSLSYHDLPYYLKSCFLYFAIFPEDYSIRRGRLIRQWIAEGFVKEIKGKTLEDVAEDYFHELIQRSLVQISWMDFDGRARTYQVHDLMREILLSKYDELNFCQVLAEKKDLVNFDGSIRRLSMHNYKENIPESTNFSKVRSIFLFEVNDLPKQLADSFFANYRLLKVLDFEDARLENVPGELGNLFHLRYFSVRNTKVRMLPKSIGKLHNLETLDLKQSLVNELPIEILGLHKLRHLLAYYINYVIDFSLVRQQGVKMPEGIGSLEALQKLFFVEADDGLVNDLKKLRQLRKLGINKLKRENGMALCAAVEEMTHLLSLSVASINMEELLDMESISSPPLFLQRLYLKGRLEKLPDWISKLQNVVRIRLNWSRLLDDPINVLQALPNLLELGLHQAYAGEHLHFESSGFQKLKVLKLKELDKLSLVMIDQGALPILEELGIETCAQLKELPPGIQHLKSLRTLQFGDMSNEFAFRMQPDYWKVEHVPTVRFLYKIRGALYQTFNLAGLIQILKHFEDKPDKSEGSE